MENILVGAKMDSAKTAGLKRPCLVQTMAIKQILTAPQPP